MTQNPSFCLYKFDQNEPLSVFADVDEPLIKWNTQCNLQIQLIWFLKLRNSFWSTGGDAAITLLKILRHLYIFHEQKSILWEQVEF